MYVVTVKGKICGFYGVPQIWQDKDSAALYLKHELKNRGAVKRVTLTLHNEVIEHKKWGKVKKLASHLERGEKKNV